MKKKKIILIISICLAALGLLIWGVFYQKNDSAAKIESTQEFSAPQRNIESNIQNYDLRKTIDPLFNQVHDELSDAYYNKKPFRNYGVLTKAQFDKLHSLIFLIYDVRLNEENLKLQSSKQMPEKDYDDIFDDKGNVVGRKSVEAAKKIQELNAEGFNLII